ncbi:MAG TPA: hypothetical protein VD978_00825 [Azospirillum sp.]|nr:hypothetical protein [Azospirillum sp.]
MRTTMLLPRWTVILAIGATVAIAALLAMDWGTDERLGAWAPYTIAVALILLMVLSFGLRRARITRMSAKRNDPGR